MFTILYAPVWTPSLWVLAILSLLGLLIAFLPENPRLRRFTIAPVMALFTFYLLYFYCPDCNGWFGGWGWW